MYDGYATHFIIRFGPCNDTTLVVQHFRALSLLESFWEGVFDSAHEEYSSRRRDTRAINKCI
jgi:hypothetical protein